MLITVLCVSECLLCWFWRDCTFPYSYVFWGAQMIIIKSRNTWHFWHQTFICTVYMIYPYCVVVCICEYQCTRLLKCVLLFHALCMFQSDGFMYSVYKMFSRLCLISCVSMSNARTRNSPRPSTNNSSQHQKLQYGVHKHTEVSILSLVLFHLPSQCLHLSVFSVCLCIQFKKINAEEHKLKT